LFESEKLLQGENTKISSIAEKCGFSDMKFYEKV
jgi:AraC-like DNA-binding protein